MEALSWIIRDKESLCVAGRGRNWYKPQSLQVLRNSMEAQEVSLIVFRVSISEVRQDCIKETSQNKAILFLLLPQTKTLPNTASEAVNFIKFNVTCLTLFIFVWLKPLILPTPSPLPLSQHALVTSHLTFALASQKRICFTLFTASTVWQTAFECCTGPLYWTH